MAYLTATTAQPLLKKAPSFIWSDTFVLPMSIAPLLNANFGAIRENHFHSGLDFNTRGKEGFPVYAVSGGYVSRIKIQSGGYGNALYIAHPNGTVSLYGHLQRYNHPIAEFVKKIQYGRQKFEMDATVNPGELPVTRGQVVAYSGNTGFSGGPHLHFELRDSATENIYNVLLFHLPIADTRPPAMKALAVYSFQEAGGLRQIKLVKTYPLAWFNEGAYRVAGSVKVMVPKQAVLGIIANDFENGSTHKMGVYAITLLKNQRPIFHTAMDHFGFDQTRSVNSFLDYASLQQHGIAIMRSFIEPGNFLPIYQKNIGNGVITTQRGATDTMQYMLGDENGNVSSVTFFIALENRSAGAGAPEIEKDAAAPPFETVVPFDKSSALEKDAYTVVFPKYALFDNQKMSMFLEPQPGDAYPALRIGDRNIPIKDSVRVEAKRVSRPEKSIFVDEKNKPVDTYRKDGLVYAWIKKFGVYRLAVDTVPPTLYPLKNYERAPLGPSKTIFFKASDNLSGIGQYNGYLDGTWVLVVYDAKNNLLATTFEGTLAPGTHRFKLQVTDKVGNMIEKIINFNP